VFVISVFLRQAALLPILFIFLLTSCGGEGPDNSDVSAVQVGGETGTEFAELQTLRVGNGVEPQTLDPHRAEGVPAANILRDLYEGLTIESPDGEIIPGVATRWETSEDGRTYTFYLREDARWSNGDPVTAADFVFGFQRSVDPETLSNYSSILEPVLNAAEIIEGVKPPEALGVKALNDFTLEISLIEPTPYLPGLLNHSTTYPVHRASVQKHGSQFARPGKLIGNGAYVLDEWAAQSHIKLIRNQYYWDDAKTIIDTVYFYPIENQDTELKRYRADELDITGDIPYPQLPWIRENLAAQLAISPYLGSYYFGFNVTRPPFENNANLRRALSLAIDREIIAEKVAGAGEIPAFGWVPPIQGYQQAVPEWADWSQSQRDAEALRLYREAGYSKDKPLTIEVLYNTSANHKRISVAIASMWKQKLGIQAKLLNQEWKVFLQTRRRMETTEVYRAGWIGDYNDAYSFAQLMHSANEMNHAGYVSTEYDALVDQAASEQDMVKRGELLTAAEQVLLEDMPIIPVYFYVSKHLVKPWVQGRQPNIMDHHYTKNLYILKH